MSSTTAKPLSDDEASKEMKKMVAFIMQEAAEKSREIHVKADGEFNIEKAKLVHQETAAIETQFGRKIKQAEVKRRM
jgi:V-type H+-transporting ATPase subunit E